MMMMMSKKKKKTTKVLGDDDMEQLKERARAARKKFVLSEKAIQSGGDRSTKFGYCLMYVNAIQKSVNGLDFGGKGRRSFETDWKSRDVGEKKRSPRDAAFEVGEEDEEKKRRTKKTRKEHEEREEKEPQKEKEDATKTLVAPRTVKKSQTTKSEMPSPPPTTTGETKKKTATNGTTIEENDEATNTKATKKKINPGRYPGEYCQYCGEHEHMVHVKYASQVLGEGKLVCYGCLAEEKKELERKQKVMTNAKKREKNRQAKMKMKAAMLSTPTGTTVTSTSNLPSLPLSSPPSMIESPAVPNDAITAPQQQPSPVSVAVVVDGETARVNTVIHNIATPIATTEHIEAIHDVVCDLCGKNTFRTAAELKVHKMKWCIAKNSAVMASTLPIERKAKPTISLPSPTALPSPTPTPTPSPSPTFENEDAQDSGKGKSNVTNPRILPIAEVLHKAKYGFPVTKIASSSNLSFHVVINDSIDDNNNNAAALALPRKLNKEELVEEQQNNHRSDNKRPSGPSMKKEFKKNVWRTDRKT